MWLLNLLVAAIFLCSAQETAEDKDSDYPTPKFTVPQDSKPNFILIVVDEQRFPPKYEAEMKEYRQTFRGQEKLKENGVEFLSHYTASIACSPSRTTLYTGQYPAVHGITQTYGLAKEANDPEITFLEPGTVPTIGNFFEAGGYETRYFGKWHISFEDIVEDDETLVTKYPDGTLNETNMAKYKEQQRLKKYGFEGWVGPDPHGAPQSNSGYVRDSEFSRQFLEWLDNKEASNDDKPFFVALNYVNPHDTVYFPFLWKAWGYPSSDPEAPPVPEPPTFNEDLSKKPTVQAQYLKTYKPMMGQLFQQYAAARDHYNFLMKTVDNEVDKVVSRFRQSKLSSNTFIIFTSDHGEMLGAHGGLQQKWYQAYEETIHIPLIISHPLLNKSTCDVLSSSVDIVPTMLSLAKLDLKNIFPKLKETHSEVHKFPGKTLKGFLSHPERQNTPGPMSTVYGSISDRISRGKTQVSQAARVVPWLLNFWDFKYDAIRGADSIEYIVTVFEDLNGTDTKFKLVRYWDNPALWTTPNVKDEYEIQSGSRKGEKEIKTTPTPEEWEFYNLDKDPFEQHNLHGEQEYVALERALMDVFEMKKSLVTVRRNHPLKIQKNNVPIHRKGLDFKLIANVLMVPATVVFSILAVLVLIFKKVCCSRQTKPVNSTRVDSKIKKD